jgi:hypothetical protein
MSNPFSARRTQRSQRLKVAEYTSTAVSVVGVVVSALSQQAVYAAAPLSLSLCLNLVNRRRFEQQTEQRFNGAIAQIDQRLLHLDQRVLEQSVLSLTERVTDLSEQLTAFQQSQNETAIDLSELRALLSQLQERFTTTEQGQNATATNLGELQARLSQLNAQLTAIQQRQTEAGTSQTESEAQFSQVRENLSQEIQAIRQQLQAAALSLNGLEALQQAFPRLTEQISQLQERLLEIEARLPTIEPFPTPVAPELVDLPTELEPEVEQAPISPTEVERLDDLEDLVLNLGIDFGTSFTKVCFRDVARERSEIVTFTDEITHLEEALLPTKIGILPDGTLITGLTVSEWKQYENQVQTTVEFIKMRLANFDLPQGAGSWQLEKLPGVSNAETVENFCAYYLSRVMTRAQGWIRHNKPELIINQKIDWSANVGVPVEYCDSPAIERFKKVLSLAWLLSNEPQTEWMTMQNLHDRMKPLKGMLEKTAIDCHAIPEIAAEAWSLINSLEIDEGFYALFDVGDGTLDGSSFRYWNDEGEKKVDFFFGKVNPLGVTAFSQQLAQELGVAEIDVKDTVCGNSTRYSDRFQTSTARKEIQRLVAKVVWEGSQRYREHGFTVMKPGFKTTLDLLIGGGGGQTLFYRQAILSTYRDFQHERSGIPEYVERSLPAPKDLETNGIRDGEFHRFAVAYGLSIPTGEQPEIRLPKEMERLKPAPPPDEDPMGKPPKANEPR